MIRLNPTECSDTDRSVLLSDSKFQEPTQQFLQSQLARVLENEPLRPWHFWELHNPWGRAAHVVDSWRFLDLCHDESVLSLVGNLIGPDIILYDSEFSPDPVLYRRRLPGSWLDDAVVCPTAPPHGAVARLVIRDCHTRMEFRCTDTEKGVVSILMAKGMIIVHPAAMRYRYRGATLKGGRFEYVIRYFPAGSTYLRQQASEFYRKLNVLAPLQNYADKPLWLVRGVDRANNDFVTGFRQKVGHWTGAGS